MVVSPTLKPMFWYYSSFCSRTYLHFLFGRLIVSVAWVAHIVIYLLINPPLSPFLNDVFIKLDDLWGIMQLHACYFSFNFFPLLFDESLTVNWDPHFAPSPGLLGTAAFAFFCFYLLLAVIAGETMLGMRLVFITIHPMKYEHCFAFHNTVSGIFFVFSDCCC